MAADMRLVALTVVAALAWPSAAMAEVEWTLRKEKGRAFLQGMQNESEVDYEFWARCRADGDIDVGMGAESHVGKGKGEKVELTLTSGAQTVKVAGISRDSVNSEMTGGVELQGKVKRDDKLFAVLATGQPITVTGPIKTLKWGVKGLKAKVDTFLKSCK
ncbi:MAG: hypothetical protein AB1490_13680 [Pseudomonadota bacterium]